MNAAHLYAELLDRPAAAIVRRADGRSLPLHLDRWLGATTAADELVADLVAGPVLDVGCGPGRLLDAFARRGVTALGVDISPAAVALARRRGHRARLGCIFDEVPDAGTWATALLLDGNVGIGGDPVGLLRRLRGLLRPGGWVVAEVDPPGATSGTGKVRLEAGDIVSTWFAWGHVGLDGVAATAAAAGLALGHTTCAEGRWFAWLS